MTKFRLHNDRASRLCAFVLAFVVLITGAVSVLANDNLRGVAFVVGQSGYTHLSKLSNAGSDARKLEELLASLGFKTTMVIDRGARKLNRDLEDFEEDAEGADVAFVYYAGHGIEADGENYLIPIDADLQSLEDASERLVPLSVLLKKLRTKAKIVIVLLDACRSNPFAPGALIKTDSQRKGIPIAAIGLSVPRGASVLTEEGTTFQSLGEVIGFAAAPGAAALDGVGAGNSPYATALLKHLSTKGMEFGQVMTMVSEEVYLNTRGEQQPWINASLRRLLAFGQNPEVDDGDEGLIRRERRKLLLTIAATPEDLRRTVESVAKADDVPFDALYGMLSISEFETRADAEGLNRQLKESSEKLKGFLAERNALRSTDPEILRLSILAERAFEEGALQAAIAFHERAKARVAVLAVSVDQAEADIRARRLEFARVFANSAKTNELALEYLKAAADYHNAYMQVQTVDSHVATQYKLGEAQTLEAQGFHKGDTSSLLAAVDIYRNIISSTSRQDDRNNWIDANLGLGSTLLHVSARDQGSSSPEYFNRIREAVRTKRAALEEISRKDEPLRWAMVSRQVGEALFTLGNITSDQDVFNESEKALRDALTEQTRERSPENWSDTQISLGYTLLSQGKQTEAESAFLASTEVYTQETDPFGWAVSQAQLAYMLSYTGLRDDAGGGPKRLRQAVELGRAAIKKIEREKMPYIWAQIQCQLSTNQRFLAGRVDDNSLTREGKLALVAEGKAGLLTAWNTTPAGCPLGVSLEDALWEFDRTSSQIKNW